MLCAITMSGKVQNVLPEKEHHDHSGNNSEITREQARTVVDRGKTIPARGKTIPARGASVVPAWCTVVWRWFGGGCAPPEK